MPKVNQGILLKCKRNSNNNNSYNRKQERRDENTNTNRRKGYKGEEPNRTRKGEKKRNCGKATSQLQYVALRVNCANIEVCHIYIALFSSKSLIG